ncbi:MAG: hypothetical protein HC824_02565 [Synechococcales cyanobacterium RM1_1_8]|nr:hypothetical protein [Synechococcales cyanobacterium RM1_1_8]
MLASGWPREGAPAETLRLADQALYLAKHQGHNRVVLAQGKPDLDSLAAGA